MKVLWGIFGLLIAAVVIFLLGTSINGGSSGNVYETVNNPAGFSIVFAVVFPAFTGIIAGVGLSGDLKDPTKSIPRGVILAIFMGMIIYIAIIIKLYLSAPLDDLATNQHVMYDIALWGPIILLGLAATTISSAIGSILVAPRTLQAMANDKIFPHEGINSSLAEGYGKENEPINATIISATSLHAVDRAGPMNLLRWSRSLPPFLKKNKKNN